MNVLLAVLAVVAAPPAEDGQAVKSASELRSAVHASLAGEARASNRDDRLRAVAEIVRLHGELKTNENLAYRDRIRLRAKLRSRLGRVASDMERQLAKSRTSDKETPHSQATGAAGGQGVDDPERALIELIESTVRPPSWKPHGGPGVIAGGGLAAGGRGVGGAGGFGGGMHGGGLGGAKAAQAEALIELIRTTIRPESWDVNGGRGTIMYWPGS